MYGSNNRAGTQHSTLSVRICIYIPTCKYQTIFDRFFTETVNTPQKKYLLDTDGTTAVWMHCRCVLCTRTRTRVPVWTSTTVDGIAILCTAHLYILIPFIRDSPLSSPVLLQQTFCRSFLDGCSLKASYYGSAALRFKKSHWRTKKTHRYLWVLQRSDSHPPIFLVRLLCRICDEIRGREAYGCAIPLKGVTLPRC